MNYVYVVVSGNMFGSEVIKVFKDHNDADNFAKRIGKNLAEDEFVNVEEMRLE